MLDVSGSMEAYARALLLYLHAARGSGRGVETFAFGTRLTRLTRGARDARPRGGARGRRDARRRLVGRHAHRRVAEGVQRRVGPARADARRRRRDPLRRLRARRPRRSSATRWRGSRAQAFAVVWVNPLKGTPTTSRSPAGMRAALPYVDRFVSGHDVASLETLGRVLAASRRRHAA